MSRMEITYKGVELEFLDIEDLQCIEQRAKGLTLEECFEYLLVTTEEIPKADLVIAKKAHRRGRSAALHTAVNCLFGSMTMRGGGTSAMEYLKQLSGTFTVEATPVGTAKGGFQFNVVMPEEEA